jgi:hypothetical protein
MFEISPFSSFNELIDLNDFFVVHSRLHKYVKKGREDGKIDKIDAIGIQKMEEIKIELNDFQRVFSLAAISSASEFEALK